MSWPWVSRRAYDEVVQSRAHYAAIWEQSIRTNEAILEKYHALRLQGAATPEPSKPLDRPNFDPVVAAITAKAGPDRKLRAIMSREAMTARTLGISDSEIIQQIEQGVAVDEGIPL